VRRPKRSHNTPLALLGLGSLAVLASISGGAGSATPVEAATVETAVPAGSGDDARAIRSVDFSDVPQPGSACSEGLRFSPPSRIPVAEGASQVLDLAQLTQLTVDPHVAYGDVTGDGVDDAVVHVTCSYGANGAEDSVHVWTLEDDRLVHVAQLDEAPSTDDDAPPPAVKAVSASDGDVVVTWSSYADDDAHCCPTRQTRQSYRLDDDELDVVGEPVTGPAPRR